MPSLLTGIRGTGIFKNRESVLQGGALSSVVSIMTYHYDTTAVLIAVQELLYYYYCCCMYVHSRIEQCADLCHTAVLFFSVEGFDWTNISEFLFRPIQPVQVLLSRYCCCMLRRLGTAVHTYRQPTPVKEPHSYHRFVRKLHLVIHWFATEVKPTQRRQAPPLLSCVALCCGMYHRHTLLAS